MSCAIGLYGLAVMGQNLALNIAQNAAVPIAVCNRSASKVDDCVARAAKEGGLPVHGFKDVAEFIAAIAKPRAVIILVQAGQAVDDTIEVRAFRGARRRRAPGLLFTPHLRIALTPRARRSSPSTWRRAT